LYVNLEQYPSPPYFPKKFSGLVDSSASSIFSNEKTSNNVCTSQKINRRRFREGQILTWSITSFNILQAIGLPFPSVPNVYKSFLYPIEPNPKLFEEFLKGSTS
jgi:hypothetical protein